MNFILGFISRLLLGASPSGLVEMATKGLLTAQKQKLDAQNDADRIAADRDIEFWHTHLDYAKTAAQEGTKRQEFKMNHLVFWVILCMALAPGLGTFMLLSVYNVLWWSDGIWPQTWAIAGFPPPYDQWAQMSIEWVFDPVKLAATTGVAAAGGWITGSKKTK